MEGREKLKALHRALAELPERERRAFEMHRMQGLTYAEIGVALGLSQTRAYELVRAALEHCMIKLMGGGHLCIRQQHRRFSRQFRLVQKGNRTNRSEACRFGKGGDSTDESRWAPE